MARELVTAYKAASLTFESDKITWVNPANGETWEVMMSWEQPIMEKMAELCVNEGDHVLECGFGMGILSDAIQARNPASHTICENHPDIIPKMREWAEGKSNIILHEDNWTTIDNGRYNAILMDTYADDDVYTEFRQFCKRKIVKTGGKISWWNWTGETTDRRMMFDWDDVVFTDVTVDPPTNAYYNKTTYKVPVKILTPPPTGFGIVDDSLMDNSRSPIKTCDDPSSPSLIDRDCEGAIRMVCKGVYNINDGLLKVTGNHPMIIKRSGSWIEKNMNELVIGDKLYKIDNTEVEITQIDFDSSDTKYNVNRLLIDYNYFSNNILIKKGGTNA